MLRGCSVGAPGADVPWGRPGAVYEPGPAVVPGLMRAVVSGWGRAVLWWGRGWGWVGSDVRRCRDGVGVLPWWFRGGVGALPGWCRGWFGRFCGGSGWCRDGSTAVPGCGSAPGPVCAWHPGFRGLLMETGLGGVGPGVGFAGLRSRSRIQYRGRSTVVLAGVRPGTVCRGPTAVPVSWREGGGRGRATGGGGWRGCPGVSGVPGEGGGIARTGRAWRWGTRGAGPLLHIWDHLVTLDYHVR